MECVMRERMDPVEDPVGDDADRGPVAVDLGLCKACGICIELCPDSVFDRDQFGQPVVARPDACSQCLICELHCPDFAIEVRRRRPRAKAEPAEADAPALTQGDIVTATRGVAERQGGWPHDGEEG